MRQRRVKNLEAKYAQYEDILIRDPAAMKGRWQDRSLGRPVYVEIGCGKGKFISELAARESDHFFVAIEGNMSVMLRAMEKIREKGLTNVVFAPEFAENLSDWFADAEVQGIYLNFSDPLPKNYWYRRRLTYRSRLLSYFRVLAEDGTVTFKTDNTGLFEWSLLEIMAADLKVIDITRDLHAEAMSIGDPEAREAFNIETEYEAKFSGLGEKIKRVVIGRTDREDPVKMNTSIAAFNGRNIPELSDSMRAASVLHEKSKSAVAETLFDGSEPNSFSEIICTPGRTEAARLVISNYSCPCDRVLVSSAHDAVYDLIAQDMGRSVECFSVTESNGDADLSDIGYRVQKLLRNQEHLTVVFDAAACAAEYSVPAAEILREICRVLNTADLSKRIAFLTDTDAADVAELFGTEGLRPADGLRSNVLPMISGKLPGSVSGVQGSFVMCLAYSPETAEEFVRVGTFTAAAGWTVGKRVSSLDLARYRGGEEE